MGQLISAQALQRPRTALVLGTVGRRDIIDCLREYHRYSAAPANTRVPRQHQHQLQPPIWSLTSDIPRPPSSPTVQPQSLPIIPSCTLHYTASNLQPPTSHLKPSTSNSFLYLLFRPPSTLRLLYILIRLNWPAFVTATAASWRIVACSQRRSIFFATLQLNNNRTLPPLKPQRRQHSIRCNRESARRARQPLHEAAFLLGHRLGLEGAQRLKPKAETNPIEERQFQSFQSFQNFDSSRAFNSIPGYLVAALDPDIVGRRWHRSLLTGPRRASPAAIYR